LPTHYRRLWRTVLCSPTDCKDRFHFEGTVKTLQQLKPKPATSRSVPLHNYPKVERMRKLPSLIVAFATAVSLSPAAAQQTTEVTSTGIGYLQYLPDGYNANSDKYPVVIFLHGYKEKGTSSTDPKLVQRDLPRVAYVGLPKYVKFGQKYPFILISPQLKSQYGSWPPSYVAEVLNYVKKTLRIDDKRVYLTGLSLGGFGVWKTAGEYPDIFAAIAPVCSGGNALDKAQSIATANVATWAFHGGSDNVVSSTVTTNMVNAINAAPKKPNPLAKVTIFPGMGHIIWDKAYENTDLLKWMLSSRKGGKSVSEPTNSPPVVNAGGDKTLSSPSQSLTLNGSATDADGQVTRYQWSKVSGGNVTLGGSSSSTLKLSDLEAGTYVFRFTATDNDGSSAADEVTVTVNPAAPIENHPPVANAGQDKRLKLPDNSISLEGSAQDQDGSITSYHWTQLSGGNAALEGTDSKTLQVSGLQEGVYTFRLSVKDDKGSSASDDVVVTVFTEAATVNAQVKEIRPESYDGHERSDRSNIKTVRLPDKPWLSGN
jgi:pimeloyl-ACP methyl ester carboxylesterase